MGIHEGPIDRYTAVCDRCNRRGPHGSQTPADAIARARVSGFGQSTRNNEALICWECTADNIAPLPTATPKEGKKPEPQPVIKKLGEYNRKIDP